MALVADPSASPFESFESRAFRAQKLPTDRPGALSLGPADMSRPEPQEVGHRAHHLCGQPWRAHPLFAALASLRRAAFDPRAQATRMECPGCVAACVERQCRGSGADVHASCPTGTGGCCRPQEWCLQARNGSSSTVTQLVSAPDSSAVIIWTPVRHFGVTCSAFAYRAQPWKGLC